MFLIIDNERVSDAQNESVSLLLSSLRELNCDYELRASDAILEPSAFEPFAGVILSDGSLTPREEISLSRFQLDFQTLLCTDVPILGIGTGAQIIAAAYGARIEHRGPFTAREITLQLVNQSVLFDYLPETIRIRDDRRESIAAFPACFEVTARSEDGSAHALQHRTRELYAMHFSLAAAGSAGKQMAMNFLRYAGTAGGVL